MPKTRGYRLTKDDKENIKLWLTKQSSKPWCTEIASRFRLSNAQVERFVKLNGLEKYVKRKVKGGKREKYKNIEESIRIYRKKKTYKYKRIKKNVIEYFGNWNIFDVELDLIGVRYKKIQRVKREIYHLPDDELPSVVVNL